MRKFFIIFALLAMGLFVFTSCDDQKIPSPPDDDPIETPTDSVGNDKPVEVEPEENGHKYVDLGLSVKWATCNIGGSRPTDIGGYYAWGEKSAKSKYDWDTYKFCNTPELTKYFEFDGKKLLDIEDDIARAMWGGAWRMPTKEEFAELLAECEITELPDGLKFTAKNGNYIILPFGGFRKEDGTIKSVGSYGYYWTNELSENESSKAKDLIISEKGDGNQILDFYDGNRCVGLSVRPVLP